MNSHPNLTRVISFIKYKQILQLVDLSTLNKFKYKDLVESYSNNSLELKKTYCNLLLKQI